MRTPPVIDDPHILLVEPNLHSADTIQQSLAHGWPGSAHVHADGLWSAADSLARNNFDLILLNPELAGHDAEEVVMLLLQQARSTPVVVLTEGPQCASYVALGVQDCLAPADLDARTLCGAVRRAMVRQENAAVIEYRTGTLRKQKENLRRLIADNGDGMIVLDMDGRVAFANEAALALFGRGLVGSALGIPLEGGERSEVEFIGKGGRPVLADMRVMRTQWLGEDAFLVSLHEIGAAKAAVERLREETESADAAGHLKAQFLTNVSHELRAPLNAIIGMAELAQAGIHGEITNPVYARYLRHIAGSGEHLLRLINRLLEISRIDAGALEVRETILPLDDLLAPVIDEVADGMAAAGVAFGYEVDANVLVQCDPDSFRGVLEMLLTNGQRFTDAGGQVRLAVTLAADGGLSFAITDTGIGMTRAQLDNAFRFFEDADGVFGVKRPGGPGLGLALCRTLVDLHGGRIGLDSQPGRGTTVTVTLPAARCRPVANGEANLRRCA